MPGELASRIAAEAAGRGLLDVAVAPVDSPLGELLVAVTPRGLVRVAFPEEDRDGVLAGIAREISPRILESATATDDVRRELEEFFAARRTRFDVKVDRRLIHGIARDVLRATSRIPYGDRLDLRGRGREDRQARGRPGGGARPGLEPDPDRDPLSPRDRRRRRPDRVRGRVCPARWPCWSWRAP